MVFATSLGTKTYQERSHGGDGGLRGLLISTSGISSMDIYGYFVFIFDTWPPHLQFSVDITGRGKKTKKKEKDKKLKAYIHWVSFAQQALCYSNPTLVKLHLHPSGPNWVT